MILSLSFLLKDYFVPGCYFLYKIKAASSSQVRQEQEERISLIRACVSRKLELRVPAVNDQSPNSADPNTQVPFKPGLMLSLR